MPSTLSYPGVYVQLPSGVRTVVGVSTSNTAFVDFFARGPMNAPSGSRASATLYGSSAACSPGARPATRSASTTLDGCLRPLLCGRLRALRRVPDRPGQDGVVELHPQVVMLVEAVDREHRAMTSRSQSTTTPRRIRPPATAASSSIWWSARSKHGAGRRQVVRSEILRNLIDQSRPLYAVTAVPGLSRPGGAGGERSRGTSGPDDDGSRAGRDRRRHRRSTLW